MVKLNVNIVLEILGRPKEHIKEAMNTLILRLGAEKGIKVISKDIREPTEVKDSKDLFTTFAEISLELETIGHLFGIILAYMPAHIEIVSPENMEITNSELNELANNLLIRMHDYDAVVKKALVERNFLEGKLREVAPHLFKSGPVKEVIEQKTEEKKKLAKKSSKKKKAKK